MPPKGDLGNMHLPIPLVGEVIGVVGSNLYDNEEVVFPTVAQQRVDRYRRENPAEADPRVVGYGAYLLVLRGRLRCSYAPQNAMEPGVVWEDPSPLVTGVQGGSGRAEEP